MLQSDAVTLATCLRGIAKRPRLAVEEEREIDLRIQCDRDHAASACPSSISFTTGVSAYREDDEPRTRPEIGGRLHLSRERVRQVDTRAMERFRHSTKLHGHLN